MNLPLSENYTITADGQEISAYHTEAGDFGIICFKDTDAKTMEIKITAKDKFGNIMIRPLRANHGFSINKNEITLRLTSKDRISVEPYGLKNPLFILCGPYIPQPANATHIFKQGTCTDIGITALTNGDCVYIEEGAVVLGGFTANRAKDITITGNGIIWGANAKEKYKAILPLECENVIITGITIADSPSWNVVPTACKNVTINDLNIMGVLMSTDGIDIVGCEDVSVKGCFICVNDDCVAIKATRYDDWRGASDTRNVQVSNCVFWKLKCGNAIEIGYETACDEICDVNFEDIDIIHSEYEGWQSGAVFSIHNGDRGHIHNVYYKNIYIEDAQEKLIDFKILTSKYSADKYRGNISDIYFDGIYVNGEVLPPSIIRGYEPDEMTGEPHKIMNVNVQNLFLGNKKIVGQMNAHAIIELASNINFI